MTSAFHFSSRSCFGLCIRYRRLFLFLLRVCLVRVILGNLFFKTMNLGFGK